MASYPYKPSEDVKIVDFIVRNNAIHLIKGDLLWRKMERSKQFDRTWQSMKQRFRKRIIRDLHEPRFRLDKATLEAFYRNFNKVEVRTNTSRKKNRGPEPRIKGTLPKFTDKFSTTDEESERRSLRVNNGWRGRHMPRESIPEDGYSLSSDSNTEEETDSRGLRGSQRLRSAVGKKRVPPRSRFSKSGYSLDSVDSDEERELRSSKVSRIELNNRKRQGAPKTRIIRKLSESSYTLSSDSNNEEEAENKKNKLSPKKNTSKTGDTLSVDSDSEEEAESRSSKMSHVNQKLALPKSRVTRRVQTNPLPSSSDSEKESVISIKVRTVSRSCQTEGTSSPVDKDCQTEKVDLVDGGCQTRGFFYRSVFGVDSSSESEIEVKKDVDSVVVIADPNDMGCPITIADSDGDN